MGHNLDTTDGVTSFADSRRDAWHQLGQQVGHLMDGEQVLAEAKLADWNVRKEPLIAEVGGHKIAVPDKHVVIRNNPVRRDQIDALGTVGNWYEPFQNESSVELLDALTEVSGARYETAGALRGGRDTFVTMKLPETLDIVDVHGNIDRTELYIAALNSHDGTAPFRMIMSPIRIVCANTQAVALDHAVSSWSIRHTIGAAKSVEEARRSLGLALRYTEELAPKMQRLAVIEMDEVAVREAFNKIVQADVADTDAKRAGRLEKATQIMEVYRSSDTVEPFRGTAFGAFNAVTEYVDHFAPVTRSRSAGAADRRAVRSIRESVLTTGSIRTRAFDLLSV